MIISIQNSNAGRSSISIRKDITFFSGAETATVCTDLLLDNAQWTWTVVVYRIQYAILDILHGSDIMAHGMKLLPLVRKDRGTISFVCVFWIDVTGTGTTFPFLFSFFFLI